MATVSFEDLQKDLHWYSEALSKGVRAMALGIIAGLWAIFTADGIELLPHGLVGLPTSLLVRLAFILASATLVVDLLQYIAALWMTNIGIDKWEGREDESEEVEFSYDQDHLGHFGLALYWLSFLLFPAKLILAVCGGLSFVALAFAVST